MSRQCCCICLNLRQGSYLAAVYSIVLAVMGALAAGVAAANLKLGSMESIIQWLTMVAYIMWIVFAILLICGVRQNRRGWLVPWIIFTIIVIVLAILMVILSLVHYEQTFDDTGAIISFIIGVCVILLNIYALWCVVTLYRNKMAVTE